MVSGEEDVFVRTMDHVDEYLELQVRLKDALSKGLFSMAQAKYSMGLIGQQQYDMDMRASATVQVMEEADSDSMYCSFKLHRQREAGGSHRDSRAPQSSSNGATSGSNGAAAAPSTSGKSAEPAEAGTAPPSDSAAVAKDPLSWFGVMVPPPLKEMQRSFREALELCIQLANHSQQIREGIDELQHTGDKSEQEG